MIGEASMIVRGLASAVTATALFFGSTDESGAVYLEALEELRPLPVDVSVSIDFEDPSSWSGGPVEEALRDHVEANRPALLLLERATTRDGERERIELPTPEHRSQLRSTARELALLTRGFENAGDWPGRARCQRIRYRVGVDLALLNWSDASPILMRAISDGVIAGALEDDLRRVADVPAGHRSECERIWREVSQDPVEYGSEIEAEWQFLATTLKASLESTVVEVSTVEGYDREDTEALREWVGRHVDEECRRFMRGLADVYRAAGPLDPQWRKHFERAAFSDKARWEWLKACGAVIESGSKEDISLHFVRGTFRSIIGILEPGVTRSAKLRVQNRARLEMLFLSARLLEHKERHGRYPAELESRGEALDGLRIEYESLGRGEECKLSSELIETNVTLD